MIGGPGRAAVRRLCVAIDVEGYSGHAAPVQADLQARLDHTLTAALRSASVARWRVAQQDRGDGALLVLPAAVDEARVLPGLLRGMVEALDVADGRTALRLRVALTQGVVQGAATGYVGRAVVVASRLVDDDIGRDELRRHPDAPVVAIVEEGLFADVFGHGHGDLPDDGFRVASVTDQHGAVHHARLRALDATAWSLSGPVRTTAAVSGSAALLATGLVTTTTALGAAESDGRPAEHADEMALAGPHRPDPAPAEDDALPDPSSEHPVDDSDADSVDDHSWTDDPWEP